MASGGNRPTNPMFVVSAIGLFLFGAMVLVSSVQRWRTAGAPTAEQQVYWKTEYQSPIPAVVREPVLQWVVVAKARIAFGEPLMRELVERRSAREVVEQDPSLLPPGASKEAKKPLPEDMYISDPEEVEGKYLALTLNAGQPIAKLMLLKRNPLASSVDDLRHDRISIAMPPEPTVYQLLQPGDRVDIYVVVGEKALTHRIPNVRVVAVNNIATRGSGIITAVEERRLTVQEEAAVREKQKIEAAAKRDAEKAGKAPPPPTPKSTEKKPEAKEANPTGGVDEENPPDDSYKVGRRFDGRTVTVQVTREEAQLLGMTHNAPNVRLDFAVLRRR